MAQAPHFLYEKTEAQEGGYKLPKGTEQGGGGRTARPQCPHLSGEAPGLLRGRGSVCDTLSLAFGTQRWPYVGEKRWELSAGRWGWRERGGARGIEQWDPVMGRVSCRSWPTPRFPGFGTFEVGFKGCLGVSPLGRAGRGWAVYAEGMVM